MKLFLKSFFRFRISLTIKFLMAMICLVVITSAAFGWFFLGREASQLQTQLDAKVFDERMLELKRDILFVALGVIGIGFLLTLIFTRILLKPIEELASATEKDRGG